VTVLAVASMLVSIGCLHAVGLHRGMHFSETRGVTLSKRDKQIALAALGLFLFGTVLLLVAIARDPMSVSTR
jgi:hypothetical protein